MKYNSFYKTYIRSTEWSKKKSWYWAQVGVRACQVCGSRKSLQVHHMDYVRLGNEVFTDLMGLCYDCHTEVHKLHKLRGGSLKHATLSYQLMNIHKKYKLFKGKKKK